METTFSPKGNIHGPILPKFILTKAISLGAKVMYALLCDYAGKSDHCWPSQKTLAAQLSCSLTSVKKYLAELVNEKLVVAKKENYRSSVYYLLKHEDEASSRTASHKGPISVHTQPKSDHREPESGYLTNLNKQKENTPPNPPTQKAGRKLSHGTSAPVARGVGASLSDFEAIWKLYPKKEAIGFARRMWVKLHKHHKLPPPGEIISAIRRFTDSPGWQREEGRYIPQLGKWLMDERWLDGFSDNCPARYAESAQKIREMQELRQKRELERTMKLEKQNSERRPIFDAFLSRFTDAEHMRGPAWGFWNLLYSKGKAPRAEHVPPNNTLGVMKYLQLCQVA